MAKKEVMPTMVKMILQENKKRLEKINRPFKPIKGEGSIGKRFFLGLKDYIQKEQYLPIEMKDIPMIRQLKRYGSVGRFLSSTLGVAPGMDGYKEAYHSFLRIFIGLRSRYDFPYWAALLIMIKNKGGGEDVKFRLTRPQRRLVEILEGMRKRGVPIRIILLKARQWGGSTTIQLYMAWLQLVHLYGLNSLIIAHQGVASDEVKAMFEKAIKEYPLELLYRPGEDYDENEPKWIGVGHSGAIHRVPQRSCNIKVGTAERPDSCRGGDYNLVHLSEVGVWKTTEGKRPEDIVRSACSGVLLKPYTMIVYESTANGVGNFFHKEYQDAKEGKSSFTAVFVPWYEIDLYTMDFSSEKEREAFALKLYNNRNGKAAPSNREEPGRFLWYLWKQGATLEAIYWYTQERAKYNDHAQMAGEYPTDDIEAFVHSGNMVFDRYLVENFRASCSIPQMKGEVYGKRDEGPDALKDIKFKEDAQGYFWVWDSPDIDEEEKVVDRYLVVVDIGGRSDHSDWSVIVVFDRLFMMDGDKPMVVAQWYGHIDMDLLSWKAAQIASWYDNALLVIESNTLETHDKERQVDGDQSSFILTQLKDVYPNLYQRQVKADSVKGGVSYRYGFHTNVATKPMIISTLVKVIRDNLYVERDARCLDEYLVYERRQNNSFGAIIGKHDDLLMTRAIGLHVCFYEMELPRIINVQKEHALRQKKKLNKPSSAATF